MMNMSGDVLSLTLAGVILAVAAASNYIQGESIKAQAQTIDKLEKRVVDLELSNKLRLNQEAQDKLQRVMTDEEISKIAVQ